MVKSNEGEKESLYVWETTREKNADFIVFELLVPLFSHTNPSIYVKRSIVCWNSVLTK